MLLSVTGGFTIGGGTESEARFKTPSYQVDRRSDADSRRPPVRRRRQSRLLAFAVAGKRAFARPVLVRRRRSRTSGSVDFVIGRLSAAGSNPAFIQAVPNTLDMQQWYVGLYAQDTWQASPKLTLNYGVRWEPALAQQIRNGAIYNFDLDRFLRRTEDDGVQQCAAGIPVSGRSRVRQWQRGHGQPLESVVAACRRRVGPDGNRHERAARRVCARL